jgi:hypothetical protein
MIDTKYFKFTTGTTYLETPPKLFVDWFLHRGNPRYFSWNDIAYFSFGIFGFKCIIEFHFNFQEIKREMDDDKVSEFNKRLDNMWRKDD